jgi:hypothetical protein
MKTESKTYTITLKTICGKETTNTIQAETPKEALLSMINTNPQYAKIKSKKPKP